MQPPGRRGFWDELTPAAQPLMKGGCRVHLLGLLDDPSRIPPFRLFVIGAGGVTLSLSGEGSACPTGLGGKRELVRLGEGRRRGAAQCCPRRPRPDDGVAGRARRHHPHGLDLVHQRRRVPRGRRLRTRGLVPHRQDVGDTFSVTGPPGQYTVYVDEWGGPQGELELRRGAGADGVHAGHHDPGHGAAAHARARREARQRIAGPGQRRPRLLRRLAAGLGVRRELRHPPRQRGLLLPGAEPRGR